MYVALIARDRPGSLELRMATRQAHLDYVANAGKVHTAGPLLGEDEKPIGSLIVLDVENMAEASRWADGDPYAKAGLFESVELRAWIKVI